MPRQSKKTATKQDADNNATESAVAVLEAPSEPTENPQPDPYRSIFTCAKFTMGENRRFKQRVFRFNDKPDAEVLSALKENGFTYRAAEKQWTIPATAESRVLSDRLAREFSGFDQSMSR